MAPKTMGLTTFPKDRPKANQALFKGVNTEGATIVTRAKNKANDAEMVAKSGERFHRK